jgi:hypothetical protein
MIKLDTSSERISDSRQKYSFQDVLGLALVLSSNNTFWSITKKKNANLFS